MDIKEKIESIRRTLNGEKTCWQDDKLYWCIEVIEQQQKELESQTPQKVIKTDTSSQACPICKSDVNLKYCSNCRQKLIY